MTAIRIHQTLNDNLILDCLGIPATGDVRLHLSTDQATMSIRLKAKEAIEFANQLIALSERTMLQGYPEAVEQLIEDADEDSIMGMMGNIKKLSDDTQEDE